MATSALDRETILHAIRAWPPDERMALIQDILRQARIPLIEEPIAPPSSRGLAGLLATDQPPPTDEDIARWLDAHQDVLSAGHRDF